MGPTEYYQYSYNGIIKFLDTAMKKVFPEDEYSHSTQSFVG